MSLANFCEQQVKLNNAYKYSLSNQQICFSTVKYKLSIVFKTNWSEKTNKNHHSTKQLLKQEQNSKELLKVDIKQMKANQNKKKNQKLEEKWCGHPWQSAKLHSSCPT